MKLFKTLCAALCLALIACVFAPAALPGGLGAVTEARAAAGVKINKTKAVIFNGTTLQLKLSGAKGKAKWSSSDKGVARVSQKGLVTAKKAGKATIVAEVGGQKFSCKLTVKSPLSSDASRVTLKAGQSKKVMLTWKLPGAVSLKKYDGSVIECALGAFRNGKAALTIRGIRAGTQTVSVTNNKTRDVLKIKVTVKESGTAAQVADKASVKVKPGGTAQVKVTWPYAAMPYMLYDPDVATAAWGDWNGSGWPLTVRGVARGTADVVIYKGKGGEEVARIKVVVK